MRQVAVKCRQRIDLFS